MPKYYKKFVAIASSKGFFWVVIILFVVEAAWFALSSRYPMAFDETYHFSLIQIYSHQLSPFFTKQPPGPLTDGPLVHNSSFLFSYLMSFPYRLISHFSSNLRTQVTFLRFINILLFTWAMFNFRKILIKVRDEPALANITLLFFIFIPVVPFLAAQINYDNLSLLLISYVLLWTIRSVEQLRTKQQLNIPLLIGTFTLAILGSMVSSLFLPIFVAVVIYLLYVLFRFADAKPNNFKKAVRYSWRRIRPLRKLVIFVILLVSVGLFIETLGINIVKYYNPYPACNQLLSVDRCQTYSPWESNYIASAAVDKSSVNPISYTRNWIQNMNTGALTVSNGPQGPEPNVQSTLLPVLATVLVTFYSFGVLLFVIYGKRILRDNPYTKFLLFVDVVFIISVWAKGYYDFWHLGQLEMSSGRYLVPIIIPIIFIFGLCYKRLLINHKKTLAALAVLVFLCLLEGGGVISFINSSNTSWYWPNDQTINNINLDAQKIIRPAIIN